MRKSITILFVMFYVLLSLGPTFSLHYCGGRLESLNLFGSGNTCCCGDEAMNESCCENHDFHYQLTDEQRTGQEVRIFSSPLVEIDFLLLNTINLDTVEIKSVFKQINFVIPPPDKAPAWIKYCSLILYA